MEIYLIGVVILIALAISDLIVGVSNDAVNFLNSSIGSRVAPRKVIMIIASLGMLAGVTFSSGMMEVARKGIFHPQKFFMPELMVIFLAVMLTDILLLDLYNTFGLPTSTTVSIVFELLGAAVAVSLIKIARAEGGFGTLVEYINTGKALAIISGILLSVVVAFVVGALLQFVSRLVFTFDFQGNLKRIGAVWGGFALAAIVYFILIKGSKGASFLTPESVAWIKGHTVLILIVSFLACFVFLQILVSFTKVNILKVIILIGTFALAMAFAANDLVNFIGVPLAGLFAYQVGHAGGDPGNQTMEAMQQPVQSNTWLLLVAGLIMVVTLFVSRKARTVTRTELGLGRQDEGVERFGSSPPSRVIVRMVSAFFSAAKKLVPRFWRQKMSGRIDQTKYQPVPDKEGETPSFDLVRAAVNLMVASMLISIGTSMKLPLSTTYVTFMVAMGTSFSDRAWGRETAVYRITGVLTVIGGWFFTAFMAFTVSSLFAMAIYYWRAPAVLLIFGLSVFIILRNHRLHRHRESNEQALEVFNLKKITDPQASIDISFKHTGIFLERIRLSLEDGLESLVTENRPRLKILRKETRAVQRWANIIIANIFKILRLFLQKDIKDTQEYSQIINSLQEIAESHRDMILRAHTHIENYHKGLLAVQVEELREITACTSQLLQKTAGMLLLKEKIDLKDPGECYNKLRDLITKYDRNQIKRIQDDSSKTRLSILFYGFIRDSQKVGKHTLTLLEIFEKTFKINH